ncbi:hypothetical protein P8452_49583 [Trifolium repens]|nr:hypothetical protein P8452_49583 [Trifolium repens]
MTGLAFSKIPLLCFLSSSLETYHLEFDVNNVSFFSTLYDMTSNTNEPCQKGHAIAMFTLLYLVVELKSMRNHSGNFRLLNMTEDYQYGIEL